AARWPAMIAQFMPRVTMDRAETAVRVFNRTWAPLGEPVFGGDVGKPLKGCRKRYQREGLEATPKGSLLVQCEAQGFDTPLDPKSKTFAQNVLFGPFRPKFSNGKLVSGSIYGWLPNT